MRRFWVALIVVVAGFLPATASAHRQPEVMTTIARVLDDGVMVSQVTHRLHAHDVLHVLGRMPGVAEANLDDQANLARIALYVSDRIGFADTAAETIGADVDGNFVFIYQIVKGHPDVVRSTILSDLDPAWSNYINYEDENGTVEGSVLFSREHRTGAQGWAD